MQGDKLTNDALMIAIAVSMLPLSVILSVWSAKGTNFHIYSFQNEVNLIMLIL